MDWAFALLFARLTRGAARAFTKELAQRGGPPPTTWVSDYVNGMEIKVGAQLEHLEPAQVRQLVLGMLGWHLSILAATYGEVATEGHAAVERALAGVAARLRAPSPN